MPKLEILFCDDHYVAVNKPAGLLVHRSPIDRRETVFALQLVRDQLGQRVYPVHRLDKPTSGVLLFGRSPEAARALCECFTDGGVSKTYLAVVRGIPAEAGVIDHPLADEYDPAAAPWGEADSVPRPSVTAYRRLASIELPFAVGRYPTSRYSLVEASPRTGRRHQLRRHFKHLLHPIVGDTKYGEGRHNRFFREQCDCHRLLLAAAEVGFHHPFSKAPVVIAAPLDAGFNALLDRFGWRKLLPTYGSGSSNP